MMLAVAACPLILCAVAVLAAGLTALYATFVPQSRLWGRNISRGGHSAAACIALTFDDGPTAASTPQVLDILRELDVKAAFFVIGQSAQAAPAILQRIAAEGHLLGNHSFTHAHLGMFRGPWFWQREIERTDRLIAAAAGQPPRYFRPPVGMKNPFTVRASRRGGHEMITWSCRGMDGIPTTPDRIVRRLLKRVRGGDIIALHDGVEQGSRRDPQVTVDALRPLIVALRQRGFRLVRLDELLAPAGGAE